MARKTLKDKEKIEKAILTLVASFVSHLNFIYRPHPDGKLFHKKCSREYYERIGELLDLL